MSKELRNTLLVAAFFILATCVAGYWAYGISCELDDVNKENAVIQKHIDDLAAANGPKVLEALQKELSELNVNFKEYVQILPSEDVATEENFLRTVQKYLTDAGITFDNCTTRRAPGRSDFEELGASLRGSGTFEQFVSFLNLLERHSSFLRVNNFTISVDPSKIKLVTGAGNQFGAKDVIGMAVSVDISTFRYIPRKR